jgi:hypothetical protein
MHIGISGHDKYLPMLTKMFGDTPIPQVVKKLRRISNGSKS